MTYKPTHITGTVTTTVHSLKGVLHSITVNEAAANGVITVYDGVAATGTVLAIITSPGTLLQNHFTLIYDVDFDTNLTVVTSVAAQDITISTRPQGN